MRLHDVLSRRADAEVRTRDDDHVVPELVAQRRIVALEEVLLHLLDVLDVQILARIHDVRVEVVARR